LMSSRYGTVTGRDGGEFEMNGKIPCHQSAVCRRET
jgi:hypothetical protein